MVRGGAFQTPRQGGPVARSPQKPLTDDRRDEIDALVRANIGLAYSESRRWGVDLSYDDQESAGLVGLARACHYWERRRGRLSTLASIFIRCECSNLRRMNKGDARREHGPEITGVEIVKIDWRNPSARIREQEHEACVFDDADAFLDLLSDIQRKVVRLRFGIGIPRRLTLEQVGERIGVSKERVRQIQVDAMRIMRGAAP